MTFKSTLLIALVGASATLTLKPMYYQSGENNGQESKLYLVQLTEFSIKQKPERAPEHKTLIPRTPDPVGPYTKYIQQPIYDWLPWCCLIAPCITIPCCIVLACPIEAGGACFDLLWTGKCPPGLSDDPNDYR
jgi:hypothetical protein